MPDPVGCNAESVGFVIYRHRTPGRYYIRPIGQENVDTWGRIDRACLAPRPSSSFRATYGAFPLGHGRQPAPDPVTEGGRLERRHPGYRQIIARLLRAFHIRE